MSSSDSAPAMAASDNYYYYDEDEEDRFGYVEYREEDHGGGDGKGFFDSVAFDVGLWSVCPVIAGKTKVIKAPRRPKTVVSSFSRARGPQVAKVVQLSIELSFSLSLSPSLLGCGKWPFLFPTPISKRKKRGTVNNSRGEKKRRAISQAIHDHTQERRAVLSLLTKKKDASRLPRESLLYLVHTILVHPHGPFYFSHPPYGPSLS